VVGAAATLEKAAECLPFEVTCTVEIFSRLEEKLKAFGFL